MSLIDEGTSSTLADALGQQADTQAMGVQQAYAKKKRQDAALAGANGRLNSGVQNYTTADTSAGELGDLGGVYSNLSNALSAIPENDYLTNKEDERNRQLALLVANMNKPSDLASAMGMVGSTLNIASKSAQIAGAS